MDISEKNKKLQTLPWYALYNIAVKKGIPEKEINGKEKNVVIDKIVLDNILSDEEIEQYVNDYIYGDRVTFTLWTFNKALNSLDYHNINSLEGLKKEDLDNSEYRNLKILSVKKIDKRIEILYLYSKKYSYINEEGKNSNVWEQHRGCLWIGVTSTYLACISKHEKMTKLITNCISDVLKNKVIQVKPPKSAIDKCTNFKAISRIVLQGKYGEKTVVSRAGGITDDQEAEINRIKYERIDTSGSFISAITDDIDATIKYNVRNGSIGIYKHLPSSVLFKWSENAISVILDEIKKLKGKPAEEIFKEVGQEIKWNNMCGLEISQLNWYLTQVIASLGKEEYDFQIPDDKLSVLDNSKLFLKFPRIYCTTCESYEIPSCPECGKQLDTSNGTISNCKCGAPLKFRCSEGHNTCEIENWYIPTKLLINMINRNIQKVFKDDFLEYSIYIAGNRGNILIESRDIQHKVEVSFEAIECFKNINIEIDDSIKTFAVNMNEKCENKTCSYNKIEECVQNSNMVCLPKVFFTILPGYKPQPHKGMEYGDVSGEVEIGNMAYELKGIIKKNSKNNNRKTTTDDEKIRKPLLSSSKEGQEIIRQFVEQGMIDNRCQIIAVIIPQYIDASLKGTLRHLARLSGKKIVFIELDEICKLISSNEKIAI